MWAGADASGDGVAPRQAEMTADAPQWTDVIRHGLGQLTRPFGTGDALTSEASAHMAELAAVAKAHPDFPLLVVVHAAANLPAPVEAARAERASTALRDHGAPSVQATSVGNALPGLDRKQPGAAARNDRVEIVFVAPSAT